MRSPSAHIQGQDWKQTGAGVLFPVPKSYQNVPSSWAEQALGLWPAGADGQLFIPRHSPWKCFLTHPSHPSVLPTRILAGQPVGFRPQNIPCALRPPFSSVTPAAARTSAVLPLPQASQASGVRDRGGVWQPRQNSMLTSLQRVQRYF